MNLTRTLFAIPIIASVFAGPVGFRGDGSGTYPAATPLLSWSATEKVVWATALPDWGNACPVVLPDRIFVGAEPNTLVCLDKQGKILWQAANPVGDTLSESEKQKLPGEEAALKEAEKALEPLRAAFDAKRGEMRENEKALRQDKDNGELKKKSGELRREMGDLQRKIEEMQAKIESGFPLAGRMRPVKTHKVNGYSSDTPLCVDGRVYVCYGNGVAACYSRDGKRQWIRFVEKPTHVWGQSASPVISGGVLLLQYVKAWGLDPATGDVKWSVPCAKNWGTAAPISVGKIAAFITDMGLVLSSVDGSTLLNLPMPLEYGSPLVSGSLVYGASSNAAWVYQFGESGGKIAANKLWEAELGDKKDRYYASPLLWQGVLYLVSHKGTLYALDAGSGKRLYEKSLGLGGTAYPSPILCGNVLIVSSDSGKSVLVKPGAEFAELGRTAFEPFRSTPVCEGKRMYIRTLAEGSGKPGLYCLEE